MQHDCIDVNVIEVYRIDCYCFYVSHVGVKPLMRIRPYYPGEEQDGGGKGSWDKKVKSDSYPRQETSLRFLKPVPGVWGGTASVEKIGFILPFFCFQYQVARHQFHYTFVYDKYSLSIWLRQSCKH